MSGVIVFFIGTTAELIKLFPVIKKLEDDKSPYLIISSGQNDIISSVTLKKANGGRVDLVLSQETTIKKTSLGLLKWWITVFLRGIGEIRRFLRGYNLKKSVFVVHGDTVSTVMGAMIGKILGIPVAHVEAGLRSFHLLSPFPEEIDRILTSKLANYSFAPGDFACRNLEKSKTKVINTYFNTAVDSLALAREQECTSPVINNLLPSEYFVFVMHRQENLANKEFVKTVLDRIIILSKKIKCVVILHTITKNAFIDYGYMEQLKKEGNIVFLDRQEYFDFIKLLSYSSFVITDGGSNQEELNYLGKPCLILRSFTERLEGVGENAEMYNGEPDMILSFADNASSYRREPVHPSVSPTEIITETLKQLISV